MSTSQNGRKKLPLDIMHYVDSCDNAARRSRTVIVVLVVACVVVFVSSLNSLHNAWMLERIRAAYDPSSDFVDKKLGVDQNPVYSLDQYRDRKGHTPVDDFRKGFRESLVKSYVENTYFIKAPFFGVVFDVNYVGLIGGIALFSILILLKYSLLREIKNLCFCFVEVGDDLDTFYHALAMRQVLTVPRMRHERRPSSVGRSERFFSSPNEVGSKNGLRISSYFVLIRRWIRLVQCSCLGALPFEPTPATADCRSTLLDGHNLAMPGVLLASEAHQRYMGQILASWVKPVRQCG